MHLVDSTINGIEKQQKFLLINQQKYCYVTSQNSKILYFQ